MLLIRFIKSHSPVLFMLPKQTAHPESIIIDDIRYTHYVSDTSMFCYLFNKDGHIVGVELHLSYDSPIRTILEKLSSPNNQSNLDAGSFVTIWFSHHHDDVVSEDSEPYIWYYVDSVPEGLIIALSTFSFVETDFDFRNIVVRQWEGHIEGGKEEAELL